jgi:hypothetical protein
MKYFFKSENITDIDNNCVEDKKHLQEYQQYNVSYITLYFRK